MTAPPGLSTVKKVLSRSDGAGFVGPPRPSYARPPRATAPPRLAPPHGLWSLALQGRSALHIFFIRAHAMRKRGEQYVSVN